MITKKGIFIATMILMGSIVLLQAQEISKAALTNRYGINLRKEGDCYIVWNKVLYAPPFNADSTKIPEWNIPYTCISDKIKPADLQRRSVKSYVYKSYPSYDCRMDVFLPKGFKGPFPFIMFIHGGGWRNGNEKNMALFCNYFASQGIASISVSYTLMGQGSFKETASDLNDAFAYIQNHAKEWNFDPKKFGFSGFSAGGHLSSYMAMTVPDTKVLISVAGPHNLYKLVEHAGDVSKPSEAILQAKHYFVGDSNDFDLLKKCSPYYLIPNDPTKIPSVMLVHGTFDTVVEYQQSVDFQRELRTKGAKVAELLTVPYTQHVVFSLEKVATCEDNLITIVKFAKEYLDN